MKNAPFFKLVAAIIFVGVIVALASPAPTAPKTASVSTETTPAVHATE